MARVETFPVPAELSSQATLSYERPSWVDETLDGATGRGVRIALVDSGLDVDWQVPHRRPGVDLATGTGDSMDGAAQDHLGHGTACASILWAVAPEAQVYPVRIFHRQLETRVSTLVRAIDWSVEQGMDVVNLSLGTIEKRGFERLYRACELARQAGVILVAAVESRSGVSYPAVFDNTIGVHGGLFSNGHHFEYRADEAVEAIAQGRCRARTVGGRYRWVNASSFAAPHLSAIVALFKQRFTDAGLEQMHRLLSRYAVTGDMP